MNSWNFTGNLGRDADVRFMTDGGVVLDFSVAVKSGFGERESVTWPKCSMFGKRAEALQSYLVKGQLVAIVGELSIREYKTKAGEDRTSLDVRVQDITLLGGQRNSEENQPRSFPDKSTDPKADAAVARVLARQPAQPFADFADDIPF